MDTNQPTAEPTGAANPTAAPSTPVPGILAGKIPASASFIVGVLLFLMPFVDIKCGSVSVKQATGIELATGFEIKDTRSNNSLFGGTNADLPSVKGDTNKGDKFAIAALLLGLVAAIVAMMNFKARSFLGLILGSATAISLIALMIDIKSKIRNDSPPAQTNNNGFDLNFGGDVITAEFTPYFYIAVILFIAGAYFSYKQRTTKT